MQEFLGFYFMAGVYIAVAVLVISGAVAAAEKVLGLNQAPRRHQLPPAGDRLQH